MNGQTLAITYSSSGDTATANAGMYAIMGVVSDGTGLASDYTVNLTNGTLTVNKANTNINVSGYGVTYDENAHTAAGTATGVGGANLNAELNLSGTTHTNAGMYSGDVWTFTDTTGNYNNATGTVNDSIVQAGPTVTAVNPVNIAYGTALANSQLSGTATWTVNGVPTIVAGTYSYTSAAGTVLGAGNGQTETVTFTPTDTTDYTTTSSTVTVNVARAKPTVTTVNPVNITYGTALVNSQLSGTATWMVNGASTSVAGTYSYTSAAGTVLRAGNGQAETVTFTPTDTTDYTTASSKVTVNVAKAGPTVTAVNAVNITYGTALVNSQLSGTATWTVNGKLTNVAGTYSYTSAARTVLGAGNGQTETVTFTPTDTTDYTTASSTVTVNVAPAGPTVTAVNPVNITYGTALANSQLSGTATWTVNGKLTSVAGTYSYTSAAGTVFLGAGNGQTETVTFTPTDTTDYATASFTVTVNVARAKPTVTTVNPVNITYGTALANSQLSGTATWTVNGVPTTVAGTYTYTSAAGTVLNASASGRSETVTFTPTDSTDYTTASSTVTVNVAKATSSLSSLLAPTITHGATSDIISGRITSNAANGAVPTGSVTITLNGVAHTATILSGGTFSYTFTTTALTAGTYTVSYSYATTTNFTAVSGTTSLIVN